MKIYVKNMACESCKLFVKDALDDLGIPVVKVELGEIETKNNDSKYIIQEKVGIMELIAKIM